MRIFPRRPVESMATSHPPLNVPLVVGIGALLLLGLGWVVWKLIARGGGGGGGGGERWCAVPNANFGNVGGNQFNKLVIADVPSAAQCQTKCAAHDAKRYQHYASGTCVCLADVPDCDGSRRDPYGGSALESCRASGGALQGFVYASTASAVGWQQPGDCARVDPKACGSYGTLDGAACPHQ